MKFIFNPFTGNLDAVPTASEIVSKIITCEYLDNGNAVQVWDPIAGAHVDLNLWVPVVNNDGQLIVMN